MIFASARIHRGFVFTSLLILLMLSAAIGSAQASPKTTAEKLGYPAQSRLLIIHADDIGMNHSTNRAALEALERGWITSAGILVPCPWFPEVARWAQSHPKADLGIHLALNSEWTDFRWRPVTGAAIVPSLIDEKGYMPLLETTAAKQAKPEEADIELRAQIEQARQAGIRISHFDTHMRTLYQTSALFHVYQKLGRDYDLPVLQTKGDRTADQIGDPSTASVADVAPGALLLDGLLAMEPGVKREDWLVTYEKMLAPLPAGTYELIVHLGYDDDEMRGATYNHPDYGAAWRQADLETMRSPEFRKFLQDQGFILTTWHDLAKALGPDYASQPPSSAQGR